PVAMAARPTAIRISWSGGGRLLAAGCRPGESDADADADADAGADVDEDADAGERCARDAARTPLTPNAIAPMQARARRVGAISISLPDVFLPRVVDRALLVGAGDRVRDLVAEHCALRRVVVRRERVHRARHLTAVAARLRAARLLGEALERRAE